MKPIFYDVAGHCRRVTGCFVDAGIADEGMWPDEKFGPALVWGILRQSPEIIASCQANFRPWIYADHGYLKRGHHEEGHYRLVVNGYQHNTVTHRPPDRWLKLGIKLEPWRSGGRHILVCAPSQAYLDYHGIPDWCQKTVHILRTHTDRPIVVRTKTESYTTPISEALRDCHAVVTHASIAAVEAVIAGVPVFVSEVSAAYPMSRCELSQIEYPVRPYREEWAWYLAYGQWRRAEILSGEAWRHLEAELAMLNADTGN